MFDVFCLKYSIFYSLNVVNIYENKVNKIYVSCNIISFFRILYYQFFYNFEIFF